MKKILLVALLTMATTVFGSPDLKVEVYGGFDIQPKQYNFDGYQMDNPIGRFGVRVRPVGSPIEFHYEHLSSVPNVRDGKGMNMLGMTANVDISDLFD